MLPAKIRHLEVRNHILDPAEAELRITLTPTDPLPDGELRGRLVGPRCQYATTVEVAYSLRPLSHDRLERGELTARVIIPEPSLWDPESPFLYEGSAEVWAGTKRWCEVEIVHGLRVLQLGKGGLHCNGHALRIRGVPRQDLSAKDALQLRQDGYNVLVTPVSTETAPLWDVADRFGFLVLGRLNDVHAAIGQAESLTAHASCLGWLVPLDVLADRALPGTDVTRLQSGSGPLLGLEINRRPPDRVLQGIQFIFAKEGLLLLEGGAQLPVLLNGPTMSCVKERSEQVPAWSGILGWITETGDS
jgi:hypothetical protein